MNRLDLFPTIDTIKEYRKVYSRPGADEVLLHQLFDFGVWEESATPEDVTLRNQGVRLLKILGGGEVGRETIREFIRRLIRQPLKEKDNA
ncbi:MAG: hypothetical protein PHU49_08715 [Syntrophorhabdaceae bacterium]|nr:hypothetical protein [Syntrophorhabdaceae bacterium]